MWGLKLRGSREDEVNAFKHTHSRKGGGKPAHDT